MSFSFPEGTSPLDPDEAEDLIPTHIATIDELNEWEQANILQAATWLFERKRLDLLTEPFVRELHRRMFDQTWKWAGTYRTTAKNIGVPAYHIPSHVKDACDDIVVQVASQQLSFDEAAVRLHHRMVSVHPFPNGNGRHARLLTDALLFGHDRERFTWGSANLQAAGQARSTYLAALRKADEGDYLPLLQFSRS